MAGFVGRVTLEAQPGLGLLASGSLNDPASGHGRTRRRAEASRQPLILERDEWATWLDLDIDPRPLLRARGEGVTAVERAPEPANTE